MRLERFIPYRKRDVIDMILADDGFSDRNEAEDFKKLCGIIESIFHFEFHRDLENLPIYQKRRFYRKMMLMRLIGDCVKLSPKSLTTLIMISFLRTKLITPLMRTLL